MLKRNGINSLKKATKFTQELIVQSQGRKWILKKSFDFYYINKFGKKLNKVTIPKGFITDFASTPRVLYSIFPPIGIYNKATLVHDYLYSKKCELDVSRFNADLYFLQAMEVLGVKKWKRIIMFATVRLFGKSYFKVR
jgi:hypothetical protein